MPNLAVFSMIPAYKKCNGYHDSWHKPLGIQSNTMSNKKLVAMLIITQVAVLVSCISIPSVNSQSKADSMTKKSNEELIQILEKAGNVNDPAFDRFGDVVEELEKRGQLAAEAAPALAKAISYSRRDSGVAGKALIPMGQSAVIAIPILLQNLDNEREDVRLHSILNLGFIGKPAECSVPKVSKHLWDADPGVRSAAAAVVEALTNVDLVEDTQELESKTYGTIALDDPEGSITEKARIWWQETGQNMEWTTKNCLPNE